MRVDSNSCGTVQQDDLQQRKDHPNNRLALNQLVFFIYRDLCIFSEEYRFFKFFKK